jgi:hypothetical protein
VGVDSVVVTEVLQLPEITPVNSAAVGMDELPELKLVDHCIGIGSSAGAGRLDELLSLSAHR